MTAESDEPFDRWHKKYPKDGDAPCKCGSRARPLYPSADHGRGRRWQARYTGPDGKPKRPTFTHWDEARDHLAEVLTDMRRGTWQDPELGKGLAVDYAREWLEWIRKRRDNQNTVETYASHTKAHILPFLGTRRGRELRRADSNAFVDSLIAKGLSAGYVGQVFKTWRIWVNWMIDEKGIPLPANVVKRVELPKAAKRRAVELTKAEVERIVECMEPRFRVLVWMAACGGLREGEAFGMVRDRVDFLRRRWHVAEQRQRGKAVRTKTEASQAWVSLDQYLIERIAEHLAAGYDKPAPVKKASETRRRRRQVLGQWSPPADEGLIVTSPTGRPLTRSTFLDYWAKAVEEAGVDPRAHFHDLKHFYTRTLVTSGDHDPKEVQRLSRHARFDETWDTYAGSGAGAETVDVTAFSAVFAPANEGDDAVVR
ncbi:tyrosine-type recombinase/integrase [Streptomyces sp. NPDC088090]|uniref:tyrosine-type recombinase/integrase n=1 Tax=Streptomyces sp. NPDC088090 TaxID=3365822 RepID=UPI0038502DE7